MRPSVLSRTLNCSSFTTPRMHPVISMEIRLNYVGFSAILWAMDWPLHLAVASPPTLFPPSPLPLSTRDVQASPRGGTPSLHMAS